MHQRLCPSCGEPIIYKQRRYMLEAERQKKVCKICSQQPKDAEVSAHRGRLSPKGLSKNEFGQWEVMCPKCGKVRVFSTRANAREAIWQDSNCPGCRKYLGRRTRKTFTDPR